MADITITYKGATIAEVSASGTKVLNTSGQYCEGDITVNYVKPSGGQSLLDAFIDGSEIASPYISNVTSIRQGAFQYSLYPLQVELPEATELSQYAFYGSSVTSVKMPKVETLGGHCFRLSKIAYAVMPKYISTSTASADHVFSENTQLIAVDYGPYTTSFGRSYIFNGCTSLATIIIRQSTSIVPLVNVNDFLNSPFDNGKTGGTIYIPEALYNHLGDESALDYKSATNWSVVDSYGTITWAKIEGSQYETKYADGSNI